MTRLQYLYKRFQDGASSPEEESELIKLLNESTNSEAQAILDELWHSPTERLRQNKAEDILRSIVATDHTTVKLKHATFPWLKAAAITAVIALAGIGVYKLNDATEASQQQRIEQVSERSKFIKLPDGSKVILNHDSKLEFPIAFDNQKTREVILTGEAFFDIAHDASKPFIVRTGKLTTTVLGTAFNIQAYANQSDITVTVTRGKVSVSNETKVLGVLSPDDQITFSKNDQNSKVTIVEADQVVSWAEKDISFDNVTMAEAMEELSERFAVAIKFKNPEVMTCRFTATFIRGENLDQILDVICEFNQAEYAINDSGEIELSGEGCEVNHN